MSLQPPEDLPKIDKVESTRIEPPSALPEDNRILITPEQEEALDRFYEKKYGAKKIEDSNWREGESPESYLQRLLELYPGENQQTYLKMLFVTTPAGVYGLRALMAYAYEPDKPVDPKVAEYYPPELNMNAKGIAGDQSRWYLKMSNLKAAEVITACNSGVYKLKKWSHEEVKRQRETLINIVTGKENVPDWVSLRKKVKIGFRQIKLQLSKQIIGQQMFNEVVRKAAEESIPFGSLDIDESAQTFIDIADQANGEISPIDFYVLSTFHPQLGLDDLDIHPDVGSNIFRAFDMPFRKK